MFSFEYYLLVMLLHKLLAVPQPVYGECVCVCACAVASTSFSFENWKGKFYFVLRRPIEIRIEKKFAPKWIFTTLTKSKLLWWLSNEFLVSLIFIQPPAFKSLLGFFFSSTHMHVHILAYGFHHIWFFSLEIFGFSYFFIWVKDRVRRKDGVTWV